MADLSKPVKSKRIAPPTKMKGYLSMQKVKAFAKWYKRFCLLQGACLKYYDEFLYGDDANVARGVIVLEKGRTVVTEENPDGQFRIRTGQGDEYIFKGDSAQDTSVWAKAVQNSGNYFSHTRSPIESETCFFRTDIQYFVFI